MATETSAAMIKNLQDSQNYWKLVSIRESIGSMEFKDSRLETLISSERKLVGVYHSHSRTSSAVFLV